MRLYLLVFLIVFCETVLVSAKKFYTRTTPESWHRSYYKCSIEGKRLATLTSKAESDQLLQYLKDTNQVRDHYWIGGTNLGNEPYWYWWGSKKPMTFVNWHTSFGEPNNAAGNEYCLQQQSVEYSSQWNDQSCHYKNPYICEDIDDDSISTAETICKVYANMPVDKILGGEVARRGEFPWMAALGYVNEEYSISFDCGGTIISDYFILTAAHCVTSTHQPVVIRIGKLTLSDDDGEDRGRPINRHVQEVIRHPEYSSRTKKNDIALIRVTRRIVFSEVARPACLYTDRADVTSDLIVTGWGVTSDGGTQRAEVLHKVNLATLPLSQCNRTVLQYNQTPNYESFRDGMSESQYCAHDPQKKKDSCQGDSGGPLQIYPPGSFSAKIVGIVSFGIGCGSEWPGIYTRVAFYLDWIESHVWPNGISAPAGKR